MAIDVREALDAIEAHLAPALRAGEGIRSFTAPDPAPQVYVVIECPPGTSLDGSFGDPEAHVTIRLRLRAVAKDADAEVAGRAALDLAHRCKVRLLDRTVAIAGTGWVIGGRDHTASAGCDQQGPVANAVDDYDLWAVPASVAP